jgi:hypothetical protein
MAKEAVGQTRLQRHHRRLIDIAELKMAAANDVIEFVAEDSVTGVLCGDVAGYLNQELDRGKEEREANGVAERSSGVVAWHPQTEYAIGLGDTR